MDARCAIVLFAAGLLGGCSTLPADVPDGLEEAMTSHMATLVNSYNSHHGTHYNVPWVEIAYLDESTIAEADYGCWKVTINAAWLSKNRCMVIQEAMPHELAHLFVYYNRYGPPSDVIVQSREGPQLLNLNGPPMFQDSTDEHGAEWQQMAAALGAHPCKQGYCPDPHPYKKYPLPCGPWEYTDIADQMPPPITTPAGTN